MKNLRIAKNEIRQFSMEGIKMKKKKLDRNFKLGRKYEEFFKKKSQ